jgi:hypothetical protein
LGIQCEKYKTGTNKFTNVTNYWFCDISQNKVLA